MKSGRRALLQTTIDNPDEGRRHWRRSVEVRRILLEDRRHRLGRGVAGKRTTAGQELVQDGAKSKQIRAMINWESTHLLGRHIADGAEHDPRLRRRRRRDHRASGLERWWIVRQLRQTEVENLDPTVQGHEHILGFEIAMRDPLLVRCREAIRDVTREFERLADRDGPGIQAVPKRLAFKQFGHNEWRAGLSADVVHGEDIRVVQRGGCAGFLLESTEAIDVGRKCCGEDFDRDITSESRIARTVHLAHAASAEGGHDFVRAETAAGSEGHRVVRIIREGLANAGRGRSAHGLTI